MKELSIEEKAKAYDEAIAKGKQIQKTPYTAHWDIMKEVVEHLLPELKESEDERIRKELIFYFQEEIPQCSIQEHADKMKEFIAWLEKQGEQPKKNDVCNNCDQQGSCVSPCPMKLVEKQGEQKPAEWTAEDEEELKIALNTLEKAGQYSSAKWLKNVCLVPQTMQKPTEWSEDDQSNFNELSSFIFEYRTEDASRLITWFKSLKYRVQPKQEWSEEDERLLELSVENLTELKDRYGKLYGRTGDCIEWLKSLKDRYTWKPSKEEMKLLREVQQGLLGNDCHNRFVNFMYKLKRLREE